jgi:hypothetical protein
MKYKIVTGATLIVLLISILTLVFSIQPSKAEPTTWTVDDDGPADFSSIQETINAASPGDTIYVYPGTYYEQVVVNKSVSLIGEDDMAKPVVIANGTDFIFYVSANNVTISGFEIQNLEEMYTQGWGIILNTSSNSIVNGNIVDAALAILVDRGSGNNISGNVVTISEFCVYDGLNLRNSDNNVVTGNNFSVSCHNTVIMYNSNHNYIAFNHILGHLTDLVTISNSNNNSIVGNTLWKPEGFQGHIWLKNSKDNILYHNNFISPYWEVFVTIDDASTNNTWDDGYPSGGNYWSNYAGNDTYSGPYQNETGSDDIGDTPRVIDVDNQDRYPLMNQWAPDIAVTNVAPSKNITVQGLSLDINVTATNQGTTTETFNVTVYYDDIPIETKTIPNLSPGEETNITITWNTTDVEKGDYTISAKTNVVPGETDTTDNTKVDDTVTVLSQGHDVTIKGVAPSKTVVGQGYSLPVLVTAKNYGNFTETFNVTVYYNETAPIAAKNITLTSGNSTTITFIWNTTGVPYGNYTIIANATLLPPTIDDDPKDNTYTDGWVVVSVVGDVDGNGIVDGGDQIMVGNALWSSPTYDPWRYDPQADVNGDGGIDGGDQITVGNNLWESWP